MSGNGTGKSFRSSICLIFSTTLNGSSSSAALDAASSPGLFHTSSPVQPYGTSSTVNVIPVPTSGSGQTSGSKGLSSSGKIAVAVVVPVAAVALIIFILLFLLKRHRKKRAAEADRRKEVEEYGYNPNQDPTLPAIATAADKGAYETGQADGYRGWGQTPAAAGGRKVSSLPGGNGLVGAAYSDGHGSPPGTFSQASDVHSGDSLIQNPHHPEDSSTLAAMGGGPAAGENRQLDIHRGASNASSQYSAAARSELSGDGPIPVGPNHPQYYGGDGPYEVEGNYHPGGAYGDGAYQPHTGGQPVIRDVQARRNTRIENPTVFPQQGNAGISRNF
ncbi:hypothetical protein FGG08_001159 [Glutinoglossum americanum]|uniref:Transmembrane protein n=1 Tax=Glutinoglossum americanum TaxID=1670608 RepID=A0A9P8I7B2_9PEZI|nr:hypothetical protein FGG08_001159 [Glutinoglossum americanum]